MEFAPHLQEPTMIQPSDIKFTPPSVGVHAYLRGMRAQLASENMTMRRKDFGHQDTVDAWRRSWLAALDHVLANGCPPDPAIRKPEPGALPVVTDAAFADCTIHTDPVGDTLDLAGPSAHGFWTLEAAQSDLTDEGRIVTTSVYLDISDLRRLAELLNAEADKLDPR